MSNPQQNPLPTHVVHVHRTPVDPRAYGALAIASWVLIFLTCGLALVPFLGFASWLIAIPVFLATFIMAIVILTRGGTLHGILLLLTSIFFGPATVAIAPWVSSLIGVGGAVAAVEMHNQRVERLPDEPTRSPTTDPDNQTALSAPSPVQVPETRRAVPAAPSRSPGEEPQVRRAIPLSKELPSSNITASARRAVVTNPGIGGQVNLRAAPAASSESRLKLNDGEPVSIVGSSVMNGETEWVPVQAGEQEGWISRKFLQITFDQ